MNRKKRPKTRKRERGSMRKLRYSRGNPKSAGCRRLPSPSFTSEPETQATLEVGPLADRRSGKHRPTREERRRCANTPGKSDQVIVLRGRESRPHGEGPDSCPQPGKEAESRYARLVTPAFLLTGNSNRVLMHSDTKRGLLRSLVRENRTRGSVRGPSGNRRSYRYLRHSH